MSTPKKDTERRGGGLVLPKTSKKSERASKEEKASAASTSTVSETPKRVSPSTTISATPARGSDKKEEKFVFSLVFFVFRPWRRHDRIFTPMEVI